VWVAALLPVGGERREEERRGERRGERRRRGVIIQGVTYRGIGQPCGTHTGRQERGGWVVGSRG